jgi:hypothetical protein
VSLKRCCCVFEMRKLGSRGTEAAWGRSSRRVPRRFRRNILGASQREHVVDAPRHDRLDLLRDRPVMIDQTVNTRVTRLAFRGEEPSK